MSVLMTMDYSNGYFEKSVLDNILKLISFFILGAFAASEPDIYDAVTLVRKESSTGALDEAETEAPGTPEKSDQAEDEPKAEEPQLETQTIDMFKQFINDVLKQ